MLDLRGRRTGEAIEERIARIEDAEAIIRLKHQYARYCDQGYDADGFASLFTEDALWESNAFGVYHGREEIHGFIQSIGKDTIHWALHYMTNPIIDVAEDGESAQGTWLLLELATMAAVDGSDAPDAVLITANYDDEFVRVDGEWRFKSVKAHFHQVSNLDQGWVRQPFRGE
jgi:SnoaL-like domain